MIMKEEEDEGEYSRVKEREEVVPEAEIDTKGTCSPSDLASPIANAVFPLPGGPANKTPITH